MNRRSFMGLALLALVPTLPRFIAFPCEHTIFNGTTRYEPMPASDGPWVGRWVDSKGQFLSWVDATGRCWRDL